MSEALEAINRQWKATCRVVLAEEVGDFSEFEGYLAIKGAELERAKSAVSGKDVYFGIREYCQGSRRIAFDECGRQKPAPVSINSIKDVDSLIEAVRENALYAGNIVLGNSNFVEQSSNINDSFYVYKSSHSGSSKYLAYTRQAIGCENVFGCDAPGDSSFCIKCNDTYKVARCFELWCSSNCSDCYYVRNIEDCTECMFSFQLKSKRHCIGNLELGRDKYFSLKKKLLAEMADGLKRKKSLPRLIEIAGKCRNDPAESYAQIRGRVKERKAGADIGKMESAFSTTAKLLFGKSLDGLEGFGSYLARHTSPFATGKSAFSGKEVLMVDYGGHFQIPKDRLGTYAECKALGEAVRISLEEAEGLTLADAHEIIGPIAYFTTEHYVGTNINIPKCPVMGNCVDCYWVSPSVATKQSAFSFWPRYSDHCFGCDIVFDSSFCMDCYHSVKLQRCFECDSCRDCSDSYFCHNVENCHDCMFCFNVKNLRHAIGNVEVGKEEYARIKKMLLAEIGKGLEKGGKVRWDIYNIGAK